MHLLQPTHRPVQQARAQCVHGAASGYNLRAVKHHAAAPVSRGCLVPRQYQLADLSGSFVARGAKDGLDAELEATQKVRMHCHMALPLTTG